jgi:hypothetical protein
MTPEVASDVRGGSSGKNQFDTLAEEFGVEFSPSLLETACQAPSTILDRAKQPPRGLGPALRASSKQ